MKKYSPETVTYNTPLFKKFTSTGSITRSSSSDMPSRFRRACM